jgi:hypothetical protein
VRRYAFEELVQLARAAGFELCFRKETTLDLLKSDASASGRTERVIACRFRKTEPDAGVADVQPWLEFAHRPLPQVPDLPANVRQHPVLGWLAGEIDGTRTLWDLSRALVRQHGARPEVALQGTRALAKVLYQGGVR